MKIAFFASSLVSAYWNGAATYYRGIVRALHERGHEVTFYEPDAYDRQKHRDMADPPWAKVVVYSAQSEAEEHTIMRPVSFSTHRNAGMSSLEPSRIPAWLAPVWEERSVSHSASR